MARVEKAAPADDMIEKLVAVNRTSKTVKGSRAVVSSASPR